MRAGMNNSAFDIGTRRPASFFRLLVVHEAALNNLLACFRSADEYAGPRDMSEFRAGSPHAPAARAACPLNNFPRAQAVMSRIWSPIATPARGDSRVPFLRRIPKGRF